MGSGALNRRGQIALRSRETALMSDRSWVDYRGREGIERQAVSGARRGNHASVANAAKNVARLMRAPIVGVASTPGWQLPWDALARRRHRDDGARERPMCKSQGDG
jgi:hypothetical protein